VLGCCAFVNKKPATSTPICQVGRVHGGHLGHGEAGLGDAGQHGEQGAHVHLQQGTQVHAAQLAGGGLAQGDAVMSPPWRLIGVSRVTLAVVLSLMVQRFPIR
jgi:hypothetical protein